MCQLLFPDLSLSSVMTPVTPLSPEKLRPRDNEAFMAKQGLDFRPSGPPYWARMGCLNPSAMLLGGLGSARE